MRRTLANRKRRDVRNFLSRRGPGTALYRFRWLMGELDKRYPTSSFLSFPPPEQLILLEIDNERLRHIREVEALRDAAESAIIALDTWTATYASEHCREETVMAAYQRIEDNGGTIAFIADTVKKLKDALEIQ